MNSPLIVSMLAAAVGMSDEMYMGSARRRYCKPNECTINLHKEGEAFTRSWEVVAHHKKVKRKKRARKNKRGF
jgi:hypothetical protein